MERLPVRYAALACVIAGGLLISGPGLLASADPGSGGTGSTTTGGDPQSTDNGSISKGFLSALSTLTGLHWLSQLPGATAPTIGSIPPPLMNLPTVPAPAAPNGPNLVQAFMLPNPGNQQPGSAPQRSGGQQPPAIVDSLPVDTGIAPQSQGQRQGANTLPNLPPNSPTITVVPLSPSGVPAGPAVTITNQLSGATPFDPHKPILPQVLPTPLVMLLTVIAKDIPLAGLVITPVMNFTLPPLIADFLTGTLSSSDFTVSTTLSADTVRPGITPSVLSQAAAALLSASQPPPADVDPMGMDVPEAPAPTPPVIGPPGPLTSPGNGVSPLDEPVAFRAGYSDYLRNAGMAQITAIAVPGALAILLFSAGGGFIGYRQARAGHVIRAEGITRFLH